MAPSLPQAAAAALDAIGDAVFVLDDSDRIVHVNEPAARLLGMSRQQLAGTPIASILEAAEETTSTFAAALRSAPGGLSRALIGPMGARIPLAWRAGPAEFTPGIPVLVCVTTSAAERFTADQAAVQAQKMEALGTLAGGVAHDFNNLLAAILGFAGLLKLSDGLDEESREQVYNIEQAARRGADIAGRLLAFSRGGLARFVRLDLRDVVSETVRLAAPTFGNGVEAELILPEAPVYVEGDFAQLQQAVLNVVLNARDAVHDGGVVTIRLAAEDERVRLLISDTGSGVPESVQARIFEPFFTTKAPGIGTGLGLAITFGIVRGHGGDVQLQSPPGRGATFIISLPNAQDVPDAPSGADAGDGNLVLVVDDDDLTRKSVSATLARLGYNVVEVGSGSVAVELVRARPGRFAAVLLDLVMPGMNGREVFHELSALRSDLPVVLCTGYAADQHIDDVMKRSIAGLLQKPFTPENLSGMLSRVGAEPARQPR
ncbi:MAG: response regulator [Dehalococcoidia bacterium]|nr:response regulator [Dehalococcoidia bacterium]